MQTVKSSREDILAAATQMAQSHGYSGLNLRDIAEIVGIKAPSIYHHFASKLELGVAVAKRYWQDTAAELDRLATLAVDPRRCLHDYPRIFRRTLENGNRLCLGSFMSAEYDALPEAVKAEVQAFADVNIAWLRKMITAATDVVTESAEAQARAIFAAVAGAQLMARSRSDIALFDSLIESYRSIGLLPA